MRRSVLFAIVAALALAVGLGSVAVADQGGAATSAKKGKKKGCKGKKKGKRTGRAHRSASASKKRGKGKRGGGCKGGGANWLELGEYKGQPGDVSVEFRSRTRVRFGSGSVCPIFLSIEVEDAKLTANRLTASVTAQPGEKGILKRMSLVVTSDYRYKLVIETSDTGVSLSCKPSATLEGRLKKVG